MTLSHKTAAAALFISLSAVIAVIAVVASWSPLTGDNEIWVHYEDPASPKLLREYSSHEACSQAMMSHDGPSGCRRADGLLGFINRLADLAL